MRYLLCLFIVVTGCTDDPVGTDGPHIAAVDPDPVSPGGGLYIEGGGFGERGHVAVGGRALEIVEWTPSGIRARLAPDQRTGPTRVVVTAAGRPSAGHPLVVSGDPVAQEDPPRRFPPSNDGGVPPDDGVRDAEVFDFDLPDVERPDLGGRVLRAEFSSDPVGGDAVFMEADTSRDGELIIRVTAARAWGVAFHLAYDRNLLRLASATPVNEARAHTAEIAPGRIAAGQAIPGAGPHTFTLRFLLLGRGEGRIGFPARYRTRRDQANRPLPTRWIEGSVRIREVSAP